MKEIKAFIRPGKLNQIINALRNEGYCCVTVSEGEGTGKYTDPDQDFPSLKFPFLHSRVLKLEMVTKDENADKVTRVIREFASTGSSGDGLIYISDVDKVIRIRDGKTGPETLHH